MDLSSGPKGKNFLHPIPGLFHPTFNVENGNFSLTFLWCYCEQLNTLCSQQKVRGACELSAGSWMGKRREGRARVPNGACWLWKFSFRCCFFRILQHFPSLYLFKSQLATFIHSAFEWRSPLVLCITLLGFSNRSTERESREHLPFLLRQMLPERPLAVGRSSCTRNHPQPLQSQVQVTTQPTCFRGITGTFLARVEVARSSDRECWTLQNNNIIR